MIQRQQMTNIANAVLAVHKPYASEIGNRLADLSPEFGPHKEWTALSSPVNRMNCPRYGCLFRQIFPDQSTVTAHRLNNEVNRRTRLN
ncbi:Hypothetical protein BROD_2081 [Brucella sp. NF 2653]|uniref:hypothetical protein n=1 Tax=unclassified Brucella TaxID=2632610 RepID=UPI0001BD8077|nr:MULTISPECIES: hypothetical protein [unclassified Brucella]APY14496.1 hypothetical protein BKD02_09700 [Brucella sp. 09RB8910]EEZ33313.1 predicted protein [Brucella sp. 83/13]EFM62041.1 Hypothetical protein BROD_2081 [Brucella sp. NF 2653]